MRIIDGELVDVNNYDIANNIFEIPEGITSIGDYVFKGCIILTEIKIPKGVTSIGISAFKGCTSLTEIKIPKGVTSIGISAFEYCSRLKKIEIPEGVTSIGECAFENCMNLTEIKIPKGVTSIGISAFNGCSSLTKIEIPEGVTRIENRTFRSCSSLTEIKMPEGITSIEIDAFENCNSLTEIKIPQGVTSIGEGTFGGCSRLKKIEIPEGVTSIGDYAFENCSSLTEIITPENISHTNLEQIYKSVMSLYQEKNDDDFIQKMFGKDVERYKKIREIAIKNFSDEQDFNEIDLNILLSRVIKSVGIEELEKMINIPNLTSEQIKQEALEKDTAFLELYEVKYRIAGELGITLNILKQADFEQYKGLLPKINEQLENNYNKNLVELIQNSLQEIGIAIDEKNKNKIKKTEETINKKLINANLEKIDQQLINSLEDNIVEQQKRPIVEMAKDVIRKSFAENGYIDIKILENKLTEKYREAHSLYIRQNAENITKIFVETLQKEEVKKQISMSVLSAIKNTRKELMNQNDGKWIKPIKDALKQVGYSIISFPEEFNNQEIKQLTEMLNIQELENKAVLKEGAEKEKAYQYLKSLELPQIVTYKQIHDMFGSVGEPFSQEFKKFFKKYKEEFLYNPEYYSDFGKIQKNFNNIINSQELREKYAKGKLQLQDIKKYLENVRFANQKERRRRIS